MPSKKQYSRGPYEKWDDQWIKENFDEETWSYEDIRKKYNDVHGTNIERNKFKQHMRSMGYFCKQRYLSNEEKEFINEYYPKLGSKEFDEAFTKKFNRKMKSRTGQIRYSKNRLKKAEGCQTKTKNGLYVKYHGKNILLAKKVLAEKGYTDKEMYQILRKDGNVYNDNIDNLIPISEKQRDALTDQLNIDLKDNKMVEIGLKWYELYEILKNNGKKLWRV